MTEICANRANFIKLGRKGCWDKLCLKDGTLRLDYRHVPEALARSRDIEKLIQHFIDNDSAASAASNHARQVADFFDPDPMLLWITFSHGYLYWCLAETEIKALHNSNDALVEEHGAWVRRAQGGWQRTSLAGKDLTQTELSGALTQTASYRGTICKVDQLEYLIAKINDQDLPEIAAAKAAKDQLLASIETLMTMLTWQDFEFLVEQIFARSGWLQVSPPGGSKKTTDIDLLLPTTGEKAFVQVKSRTDQAMLKNYIAQFKARPETRLFYAYHSSDGALACSDQSVTLMGASALAQQLLDAGLFSWLLSRTG